MPAPSAAFPTKGKPLPIKQKISPCLWFHGEAEEELLRLDLQEFEDYGRLTLW